MSGWYQGYGRRPAGRRQGSGMHSDGRRKLGSQQMAEIFLDGSSIAKRPTELCFLWSPAHQLGAYAPPIALG